MTEWILFRFLKIILILFFFHSLLVCYNAGIIGNLVEAYSSSGTKTGRMLLLVRFIFIFYFIISFKCGIIMFYCRYWQASRGSGWRCSRWV